MALRNQPYIPLYVQDIMTDEKLNECCAATHGVYIKGIMCLMHKSSTYGKILLKQKYKQNESTSLNFAKQLAKHLPYSVDVIKDAIDELLDEEVCYLEGDFLCQKRMIKDNSISEIRAKAGKKGGEKSQKFAKAKLKANPQANSEYENEYIIYYKDENEFLKDWKMVREKHTGNPTNIKKLNFREQQDFNGLVSEFSIEDFRNAMVGLFRQKDMYETNKLRPTHFLSDRNIEKYLDVFNNKTQLFKSEKPMI